MSLDIDNPVVWSHGLALKWQEIQTLRCFQPVCWLIVRPKIFLFFDSVQTQLWPCKSLRSHHQRYHVVYNWFLLHRDHGHGRIRGRFFFIWLKSLHNALMWDSEFHFIHLNIDFIAFKRFCVHLWVSHETVVAWSLDDVMARAIQVLQGRSFRWHLIGGKTAACLPATLSSGNLLCKSKNTFCKSIPSFCSSEVCVCVCVLGGGRICLVTCCGFVFCKSFLQYWLGKAMLSNIFICPLEVERVRCPGNPLFVLWHLK